VGILTNVCDIYIYAYKDISINILLIKILMRYSLLCCCLIGRVLCKIGNTNPFFVEQESRFNESCDSVQNGQKCEDSCGEQFQECSVICNEQGKRRYKLIIKF